MNYDVDMFEFFPWTKNFETGVSIIDEQHQRLVHLLNQLAAHLGHRSGEIALNQVFTELAAYADYHFKTEEELWASVFQDDPWFVGHQRIHRSFMDQVAELKEGEKNKPLDSVVEDILKFLTHWLAFHILDSDKRMVLVQQAITSGMAMDQAKQHADQTMSGSTQVLIETVLSMYDNLSSRTLELMRERLERQRIEDELYASQQQEKRFADAVVNSVPGILYLYNDQLRLVRWSDRYLDITGYGSEELANKHLLDFFEEQYHQDILNNLEQAEQKGYIEVEGRLLTKQGQGIPFLFTAVPLDVDGKVYLSGVGIDITQRKQAEREIQKKAEEARASLTGVVSAISKAVELRDPYTAGHQQRVADLAVAIAEAMHLDEGRVEGVRLGASLHDIGTLAIPTDFLIKPRQLTSMEYAVVKEHTHRGVEILNDIEFPWPIAAIVAQHHERLDGSGYPAGIKGEDICLEARIVGVADVFEAMTSHRPYREALGVDMAMEELIGNQDKLYDADVVQALKTLLENDRESFV